MSKDSKQPPSGRGGWVIIGRFATEIDARIRAALLESEGIDVEVFGANINVVDWLWQGFNPVELCVAEEDAERATEILSRKHEGSE